MVEKHMEKLSNDISSKYIFSDCYYLHDLRIGLFILTCWSLAINTTNFTNIAQISIYIFIVMLIMSHCVQQPNMVATIVAMIMGCIQIKTFIKDSKTMNIPQCPIDIANVGESDNCNVIDGCFAKAKFAVEIITSNCIKISQVNNVTLYNYYFDFYSMIQEILDFYHVGVVFHFIINIENVILVLSFIFIAFCLLLAFVHIVIYNV